MTTNSVADIGIDKSDLLNGSHQFEQFSIVPTATQNVRTISKCDGVAPAQVSLCFLNLIDPNNQSAMYSPKPVRIQLLFQVLDAAPDDEIPVSRNDTGVLVLCFTVNNVLHRNEFSGVTQARSNPLQIAMFLFADTTQ